MKINKWTESGGIFLALALFFCAGASAQQKASQAAAIQQQAGPGAYDAGRESVVSGKILQYNAASNSAPMGARITLQTSSGALDVHAGNSKLINASQLSLQAGDSVSITGENVPFGDKTVFVARIIQKGTQSVTVRSKTGMPLSPTARNAEGRIVSPGGVR